MKPDSAWIIKSFNGGLSELNNAGIDGAFKFGQSLNIRDKDNVLKCGQKLTKESGSTVTDLIRFIVPCSNGKAYGFGNAGNIYERSASGVWVWRYTDSNGEINGAEEWNSYLYWATINGYLSRIAITTIPAATWTTEPVIGWKTTLGSNL